MSRPKIGGQALIEFTLWMPLVCFLVVSLGLFVAIYQNSSAVAEQHYVWASRKVATPVIPNLPNQAKHRWHYQLLASPLPTRKIRSQIEPRGGPRDNFKAHRIAVIEPADENLLTLTAYLVARAGLTQLTGVESEVLSFAKFK